ncbi:hypothetical protein Pan258_01610 [Symmachiella dynata]|nr:hypothetical protein Pan258_01610 [Symmachiella dynata]
MTERIVKVKRKLTGRTNEKEKGPEKSEFQSIMEILLIPPAVVISLILFVSFLNWAFAP